VVTVKRSNRRYLRYLQMLKAVLEEFGPTLYISYAVLYRFSEKSCPLLLIRFEDESKDDEFRLRLELSTLLPVMRLDVYNIRDLPRDLASHVLRFGDPIYIRRYEDYVRDLESSFVTHSAEAHDRS